MPRDLNPATITAHISDNAKFAYEDYRLSLRRLGINLTSHEIFQRIMLGLSKKHIELILEDAIMKLSDDQMATSQARLSTHYVNSDARLAFDEFVLLLRRKRSMIKYSKQVVQGLGLALERPEVRSPLLPLMQADLP